MNIHSRICASCGAERCIEISEAQEHRHRRFLRHIKYQSQNIIKTHTSVHSSQHARDKTIDTPAFLDKGDESGDATLIISRIPEMCEYHALEGVDLVLQSHEVGNCFVAIVDSVSFANKGSQMHTDPSFGSSIPFSVTYSSYSNRPLNSGLTR